MPAPRVNTPVRTADTQIRFFVYARKSTESEDRQVRSIGDQLAELRELARRENLLVVEQFVESQTAKRPGRPVFNAMLDRIERGEATGILAWHPDRLARNSVDGGRIIYLLDTNAIRDLKFPNVPFDPTPSGKFTLSILFSQSKYYVDNLSENIRRGQRQKLKAGIWPQWAPLGYVKHADGMRLVPDPDRATHVTAAFEQYATGRCTLDQLTSELNATGMTNRDGAPLSRAQYHRLLRNPIYCGLIRWRSELYEGKHEPLVSKEIFDRVQAVFDRRGYCKELHLKPYLYRRTFRCGECGCWVTTETQKRHNYLRCTKRVKKDCAQRYVREEDVTRQVRETLERISIPDEWTSWMLTELHAEREHEMQPVREHVAKLKAEITSLDQKLERLLTLHLEDGLSLTEYRERKNAILLQKQSLSEQIKRTEHTGETWFEPAIRFVEMAQRAGVMARDTGQVASQRDLLKNTGSNLLLKDRHLTVKFTEPWKIIALHGRLA